MDERKNESAPTAQEQQEFLSLWEKLTVQQRSAVQRLIEALLKK